MTEDNEEIWGFWELDIPKKQVQFVVVPKEPMITAGMKAPCEVTLSNGTIRKIVVLERKL